ncbi:MAG TPA: PAS domain S-box protein [Gemmatimonadales bacterium]|nr:PAS domain S-box protein [Gemmatimonadales bacterium]
MNPPPAGTTERRLRAAVESSPSGLLMTDSEGRIILVNREIERLFGYAREELLGKPVDLLIPERVRGAHPQFRGGFMANPRTRAMGAGRDLFGLRKDGTEVPLEIGLTPVVTEEGVVVISSLVDISARKLADARFRVAVESSPNGMVMVDAAGRIVLVNREVERMFGYAREELLGQSIEMLVPQRSRELHPEFRAGFFRMPQARAMGVGRDLNGLKKDGTEFPVEIGLNPIETDEGLFVLSSIVDIGARKEAEQKRQALEDQLRQAQKLEAIGTLAGGIAHDFNNILGTVMAYAELLTQDLTAPGQREDLQQILGAAERGRQLVQQILTFSRRRNLVRKPVRLAEVVDEAAKHLRAILPHTVAIHTRVNADVPRILADPTSLHQVLLNLGTNSAHAMPAGGEIEILAEPLYVRDSVARTHPELHEGPYVRLRVRDNGEGMAAETLSRAFEPFYTTKPPGSGTGLGLAIVHGIVRDHEGTIELVSNPGEGTLFTCLFPALEGTEDVPAPADLGLPGGRGERILFVDDERSLSRAQERSLVELSYRPTIEHSSTRALELFRRSPDDFDLVITDYSMPEMNGLELAEAIHAIRGEIPILLCTGYLDELPQDVLEAAGIRLTLRKPVARVQMAAAIRELLDG